MRTFFQTNFLPTLFCAILSASIASPAQDQPAAIEPTIITIDASQTGPAINPHIYGQFIEHLGRSIYGGIWAEMLEDRKFYFPVPATHPIWKLTRNQARVLADSPWQVLGPEGAVQMVEKDAYVGQHSLVLSGNTGIFQEELGLVKGKDYNDGEDGADGGQFL